MSLTKPEIRSIEAETGVRQTELRRIFNEEMLTVADLNAGGKKTVKRTKPKSTKPKSTKPKKKKSSAAMKAKAKRTRKKTEKWLGEHPNASETVATGKRGTQYRKVFKELAMKTAGGLMKNDIIRRTHNGKTRYVSKKRSAIGRKRYKQNGLKNEEQIRDINVAGHVPKRWVDKKGNATFKYKGKRTTVKANRSKSKSR